jgi:hypothetical protein
MSEQQTTPGGVHTKHTLGGPAEVMIFFREGMFYPVQGVASVPLADQAAEHAALNPGTSRVEDTEGTVLWRLQ